MNVITVEGTGQGTGKKDIFLYALSTCGWCRKTKDFLHKTGAGFRYVDVDLADPADQEVLMEEIRRWNPACSFPTAVVDGRSAVIGFDPDRLRKLAGS
jgi:glutaredoxin-like protein NrdH